LTTFVGCEHGHPGAYVGVDSTGSTVVGGENLDLGRDLSGQNGLDLEGQDVLGSYRALAGGIGPGHGAHESGWTELEHLLGVGGHAATAIGGASERQETGNEHEQG
jgi:hypothetical protein